MISIAGVVGMIFVPVHLGVKPKYMWDMLPDDAFDLLIDSDYRGRQGDAADSLEGWAEKQDEIWEEKRTVEEIEDDRLEKDEWRIEKAQIAAKKAAAEAAAAAAAAAAPATQPLLA